jgi:hypothetical protein
MGGGMETGVGIIVFSLITGAVGLYYTVRTGLTRVERERLAWLEAEHPRLRADNDAKNRELDELKLELYRAYRQLAGEKSSS